MTFLLQITAVKKLSNVGSYYFVRSIYGIISSHTKTYKSTSFGKVVVLSVVSSDSAILSENVLSFADSFCVPVFEPLRFVEVIIILLADFGLNVLLGWYIV